MKFMLILLAVALVAWQWRAARAARHLKETHKKSRKPGPVAMVLCEHCGVHIPENDAIAGQRGAYCSVTHRQNAER